jgi:hypothetical protein
MNQMHLVFNNSESNEHVKKFGAIAKERIPEWQIESAIASKRPVPGP